MTQHPLFQFLFPIVFPILFVMALVWLICWQVLVRALAERHPATYQDLGRPAGFAIEWNPIRQRDLRGDIAQIRAKLRILRFILARRSHVLGDRKLSHLVGVMRVLFWAYTVGFGGLVVWIAVIWVGLSLR